MGRMALVGILSVSLIGCGDDGDNTTSAAQETRESRDAEPTVQEQTPSNDPIAKATAYADERFDRPTDDDFAAALSGCYLGLTGEYLGPPGLNADNEYPEPELRAILDQAVRDCR